MGRAMGSSYEYLKGLVSEIDDDFWFDVILGTAATFLDQECGASASRSELTILAKDETGYVVARNGAPAVHVASDGTPRLI